ncbi:cell envelope integrity protein TolA [Caldimonas aquatica]|uniref:Cell envelope integrity protein TolA n=1 Tax=Caldimonas aquatica TaxID=376175 RepID=A0ABY6MPP2_9BURK|nr:cell envelope integrity protein TolA [Schlegelella aquatica]UZD54099.1 cell envelope integrity protein TolA [Schlegelella aquatica]
MNAPTDRDDLMPRAPDARGRGLLLALLMHVLLVVGLALGVNWRSSEPDAVEAELWAAVPQAAAPAPPPPEQEKVSPVPPPARKQAEPAPVQAPDRQADIALERERKLKEQREKEEAERRKRQEEARKLAEQKKREEEEKKLAERKKREEQQRKEAEQRRLAEEQEKRLQAQREERLKRLMTEAGSGTAPSGVREGGAAGSPSPGYAAKLRARIRPNIVYTDVASGNPQAEVEVRAAPDGTIVSSRLLRPSGNAEWDQAVLRAIDKTQTLPRDENGKVPSPIVITFRPRDL